jgi:hypothetical protein
MLRQQGREKEEEKEWDLPASMLTYLEGPRRQVVRRKDRAGTLPIDALST